MRISHLILITYVAILSSCSENNKNHPTIVPGKQTNSSKDVRSLPEFPDTLTLVSSGQMSFYKTTFIGGIPFHLVKDRNSDTAFLATEDKKFITPEGYAVGMKYEQIKTTYRRKLQKEPGWGYYIELPSKWSLQFMIGETATDHPPVDTSKITFIFKRR